MKVAYFGFNALSSCLDLLVHHQNVDVVVIYSGEESEHTDQIIQLAHDNAIPVKSNSADFNELEQWIAQGVECFICAEYPHKIEIPSSLKYSINIHPTLLPEGRGQTPLPHLILQHPQHAGVTLHKMTSKFDEGDILLSKAISIDEYDTFDSLQTKVFLDAPMLLQTLLNDIDRLYNDATVQKNGSNWPTITTEQQSIRWSMSTDNIKKLVRAFGSLGVKFDLNNSAYYLTSAQCIVYSHAYEAGDVISFDSFKLTIALVDGFIIIPRDCLFEL